MKPFTRIIIFLFLLVNCGVVLAQTNTATYIYDNNGNRTKATIIYLTQSKSSVNATTKVEEKLDIDEQTCLSIAILPNPTQGELHIEVTGATPEQLNSPNNAIRVWDLQGKLLITNKPIGESNLVNLSSYSNGIYIMQLFFNGKAMNYKIIKN